MQNLTTKEIVLPALSQFKLDEFKPTEVGLGLAQRDSIAEQIKEDIDSYSMQMYWDDVPRHHLGASQIGHYCNRYIWLYFRWVYHHIPIPRMTRLWDRGHREEPVIIQQLRGIGCTIREIRDDGKQIQIARDSADGHFGGSLDALIQLPVRYGLEPFWILLEMKTVGSKYYKDMANMGVFKNKPQYWKQMCVYAHKITEMGGYGTIRHALFYPVNKDNDEIEPEFLELDLDEGRDEVAKAETITKQYYPPRKFSEDASAFECKVMCKMHEICHLGKQYAVNCRSCRFAEPVANGQWKCHNYNAIIPKEHLIKGCERWESLPR
jgi:hypothetical protein